MEAREPEQLLSRYGLRLENVRQRLDSAASQRLQQTEARLRHAETRLRSLRAAGDPAPGLTPWRG
ncbi:MAG: hypothetical protein ACLUE8_04700 [Lachnospiraceae bacterium]